MAASRKELIESIAEQIADYREGEVSRPTAAHVEKWITQFPDDAQDPILTELQHVFERTYFSRNSFDAFLRGLAKNKKFVGDDPAGFWREAHLLDIQQGGSSQGEMLALFREIIKQEYGADGNGAGPYVYIDDAIFSGMRVKVDLAHWVRNHAPAKAEMRIVVAALHTGGSYYATKEISKASQEAGKKIEIGCWSCISPENRRNSSYSSDVIWPTAIPDDQRVIAYVEFLKQQGYPPSLRSPGSIGNAKFFSNDAQRILLEQQLLIAGARIRELATNMPPALRPLGFTGLKTLGFGSVIVTFRNCPNTCPLAFWAGDPWYPLFPRSTNTAAFIKRMLASIQGKKAVSG